MTAVWLVEKCGMSDEGRLVDKAAYMDDTGDSVGVVKVRSYSTARPPAAGTWI